MGRNLQEPTDHAIRTHLCAATDRPSRAERILGAVEGWRSASRTPG
jgi:hypothetical protein